MNRPALAILVVLACSAAPERAGAQAAANPQALFEQGHANFRAGNFRPALTAFQRVFELTGNHAVLFNIAITWQRLGEPGEAARTLRRYLVAEPAAPNRMDLESQIRTLEEQDRALHPPAPTVSTPPAAPAATPPAPTVSNETPRSIVAPVAVTALGVVGLAAGAVFWVLRGSALESLRAQCDTSSGEPWHCDDTTDAHADYDSTSAMGLASGVAFGVGAVAAIAGGLWLFLGGEPAHSNARRARIEAVPMRGGVVFTLGGAF